MIRNYGIIAVLFLGMGVGVGVIGFDASSVIEEKIITIDTNPDLELRLQSEIDSNQKMSQMVTDVIDACNEKLLDKYDHTEEKMKRQNEILQKALSKIRDT